ncbi:MAG TPA: TlpA disulfide reductase family protein [Chloroflexia bacterium]|jgi:thiol-disulfide isomerase/thioredoxin
MSNSTKLPVRRVRTISVHNEAAEAPSTDLENAYEYGAYEGYDGYQGYDAHDGAEADDGYDGYDAYEQPQRSGLFSSPARALALGGSVVALLVVFAAAIFIANGSATSRGVPTSITSGGTDVPVISRISETGGTTQGSVPIDFEWTNSRGEKVSLASLKGTPVWINFWATWCQPCRMEMPAMQKVYTKHKDDLVILGVSMAPRDSPGLVSEFLKQYSYGWTFIHDEDQALAVKYRAGSIPMSYFIGADGTIKAMSVGAIPENMMEDFIAKAKQ